MKTSANVLLLAGLISVPLLARAQVTESFTFSGLSVSIPDNDLFGTSDSHTISSAITSITDVNVYLTISGGLAGDFKVTVAHDTESAIVLNRPGKGVSGYTFTEFGYGDAGYSNVKFDDSASNGDVHIYRLTLNGNNNIALGGPLTGTWAPDGRDVLATSVTESDPRTSLLSSFNGLSANGSWSLFLQDSEASGTGTLTSWALELSGVPEPREYMLAAGLGLLVMVIYRRHWAKAASV